MTVNITNANPYPVTVTSISGSESEAIDSCTAGSVYSDAAAAAVGIAHTGGTAVIPPNDALTAREWDVLELMADELPTKEIVARLFLSPITVRTHTNSIIKKLGVSDRDGAVRFVRGHRD